MNYYNEFDKKAAAWLRELIKEGHIPTGDVDERSITDVRPTELSGYTQCHFFAGIGGWSLALRLCGWPDNRPVWTGSCPCQPFSDAGLGLGTADPRHLWPVLARLIKECGPSTVFGEQVASAAGRGWLAGVFADLEAMGYCRAGADLCAAGVGAPHIRQRLYWMAHAQLPKRRTVMQEHERIRDDAGRDQATSGLGARREVCRLGDANSAGWIEGRASAAREGYRDSAVADGSVGGMEHAESDGRQQRRTESGRRGVASGRSVDDESAARERERETASGLGNSNEPRLQRRRFDPREYGNQRSAWSASELIDCTDGKARRVEPGTFPLAHGVPGRVGLLRGYGNAIVPQVAAEFIQACEAAISGISNA